MIESNLFAIWKSKEQQEGRRITLREVNQATGISIATLSRWMNAQVQQFDSGTLDALMDYFGCTVADLVVERKEKEA